jgi:hypothetical protein
MAETKEKLADVAKRNATIKQEKWLKERLEELKEQAKQLADSGTQLPWKFKIDANRELFKQFATWAKSEGFVAASWHEERGLHRVESDFGTWETGVVLLYDHGLDDD